MLGEINTCGDGSVWSTSGRYGACAPQTGQSLYTVCSGNWLVGGNNSVFSQEWCVISTQHLMQEALGLRRS